MVNRFLSIAAAIAICAMFGWFGQANASGPSPTKPWYIDQYGGDASDLTALYNGRVGIVMPTSPRPMRFISWRLLHGLKVGVDSGDALATPCCDEPWWKRDFTQGTYGWRQARAIVTGQIDQSYLNTEMEGPDHTSVANCFDDAFNTATITLKDRVARYGATSTAVKAWLDAQDTVFQACHDATATLPPPMPNAPAWLSADRAYQEAALALYVGRDAEAATRFAAIAKDSRSPWSRSGLYLVARARIRLALIDKTPRAYANARAAVATLAAASSESMGHDQVQALENLLDFNQRPEFYLSRLVRVLDDRQPSPQMAAAFRDYTDLGSGPIKLLAECATS